jgi:class 3 adenylate cyclase/tetratricopeptide (TPR) repeat protein
LRARERGPWAIRLTLSIPSDCLAYRLGMAACPGCGKQNADDARFCSGCGEALVERRPERRKVATLLFCDLVGSTALAERVDSETVREVMVRYFEQARTAIERHGGTVEKFIGDAVMAVFGVPVAHEDDAVRAVRAASELQAGMVALNEELEARHGCRIALRIGLNTGEVVVGEATARQSVVIGDAVNVAARLEQHAKAGETLIGEATYRLVRDAVDVEPVEPIPAKGKSEPVRAVRLLTVQDGPRVRAGRLDVPMIGREAELTTLRQAFDEAVAGRRCRLIVAVGEPGVGKSRLAAELVASIAGEATILGGRCLSYGEGITYWPLRDLLEQATGIKDTVSAERAREGVIALLAGTEGGQEAALALAQAVGLGVGSASADDIAWAVRRLFETLARQRPLVVHLEDLHWAEPAFLDLVERTAELAAGPILILGLGRSELLDQRPDWPALRLGPLRPEESDRLVESLLADSKLPPESRRRAIESAGGNPLFVEELLAMLLETPDLEAPPTLEALLAARLDRLPEDERMVAERGAVEGQLFHGGAVEELSERPETVRTSLAGLEAKELVRVAEPGVAGESAFRFRHILIRDAAYRSLPKRLRVVLHQIYARWLERVVGDRVAEYAEILGFHLEQAYFYRAELGPVDDDARKIGAEAAGWLSSAANRAFVRGDMRAAAGLLRRAVTLLESDPVGRLELLPELGKALRYSGDAPAAGRVLTEAAGLAATTGDARLEARVAVESAFLTLYTDPEAEAAGAIGTAELAAATFAEHGDELGLAKSWNLVGVANWHLCRAAAMDEAFERALAHLRRSEDMRERWWILTKLIESAVFGPTPAEAGIQRCRDLLALGDGVRSLEMSASTAIASLEAMRGNFETARYLYGQSRFIAEELGLTHWLASLGNYTGPSELLAGDLAAAEQELRRSHEALELLGESGVRSTTAAFLARTLGLQGRVDEAERFAMVSVQTGSRDDIYTQVVWRGALARVLVSRGHLERAEALAREAVAIAAETDFLVLHGESLLDLGEVFRESARDLKADEMTRQALTLFEAKGCTVLAERARALLDPAQEITIGS